MKPEIAFVTTASNGSLLHPIFAKPSAATAMHESAVNARKHSHRLSERHSWQENRRKEMPKTGPGSAPGSYESSEMDEGSEPKAC